MLKSSPMCMSHRRKVSFKANKGKFVSVVSHSGSGKSTVEYDRCSPLQVQYTIMELIFFH